MARNAARVGRAAPTVVLLLMIGLVVFQRPGRAQTGPTVTDPLPYSLSYTVTGNYATGSVDFLPH